MRLIVAGFALVLGAFFLADSTVGAGSDKNQDPKFTIKEVMKKAMAGGLWKKVALGKASDDEKKELIDLFTALTLNKPPMGELAEWKERTGILLEAAKKADKDAMKKAADCASCHKMFK